MSTGRLDHAAAARATLNALEEMSPTEPMSTAMGLIAVGQVHATLALVEQQRIANLIALGQYTIVPGEMPIYRGVIFEGENVKPEIREALGLS